MEDINQLMKKLKVEHLTLLPVINSKIGKRKTLPLTQSQVPDHQQHPTHRTSTPNSFLHCVFM